MMFQRFERYEPVTMTPRRQSAFVRKQEKERARYPLFSGEIAAQQIDIETEADRRQRHRDSFEVSQRAFYARVWRDARRLYFGLSDDLRAQVGQAWKCWTGPRTATYFSSMVDTMSGEQERRVARIEQEMRPLIEAAKARLNPGRTLPLF